MGVFGIIETFIFFSLAISFVLILLLIYHFKGRMAKLETKTDTMVGIINDIAKELTTAKCRCRAGCAAGGVAAPGAGGPPPAEGGAAPQVPCDPGAAGMCFGPGPGGMPFPMAFMMDLGGMGMSQAAPMQASSAVEELVDEDDYEEDSEEEESDEEEDDDDDEDDQPKIVVPDMSAPEPVIEVVDIDETVPETEPEPEPTPAAEEEFQLEIPSQFADMSANKLRQEVVARGLVTEKKASRMKKPELIQLLETPV